VKGSDIDPLFKWLCEQENPDFKSDINWNFEKFLLDENGKLIHRFRSKVKPLDPAITGAL
jgi:glutathione peroxidase